MNNEIVILREAIKKLVPMLAGKGLVVTQQGTHAAVYPHPVTGLPYRVNIPMIPDNATIEFVEAIQGFIDHEVAHVLFTDFLYKAGEKSTRLHSLHNIFEDTMIERRMGDQFPGSKKNIARLSKFFLANVTQPAINSARSEAEQFAYLLVVVARAMAGHNEFQRFMDDNGYWQHPLVKQFMDRVPQWIKDTLPNVMTTQETYDIAVAVELILHPPAPPAPPQPPEEEKEDQDQGEGSDDQDPSDGEDDKDHSDEEQTGDGEGQGEREHTEDNEKASGGEGDTEEEKEDDAGDGENEGSGDGEETADADDKDDEAAGEGADGSDDEPADEQDADEDTGSSDAGEPNGDTDESADDTKEGKGGAEDEESDADNADDADGSGDGEQDDKDEDQSGSDDNDHDGSEATPSDEDGEADDSAEEENDGGSAGEPADADDDNDGDDGEGSDAGAGGDTDEEGDGADDDSDGDALNKIAFEKEQTGHEEGDQEPDDATGDAAGIGYDQSNPFEDLSDEDYEDKDLSSALVKVIVREAIEACRAADYTVYTRDYDVIRPLEVPEEFKHGKKIVELDEQTRAMTGVMQKDIERMMAAQSRVFNVGGRRSGRLNSSGLHRLLAGDDRVFAKREEIRAKDTAVMLLSDCSGSMSGAPMATAMSASYALAQVLERCNIPAECMGFTTSNGYAFKSTDRPVVSAADIQRLNVEKNADEQRTGVAFSRFIPIYMPIFKEFHERLNVDVKKRFAYQRSVQPNMGGNIDGESLEYAAMRLMKRKENRKVIIVLSDGFPAGANNDDEHLKYMTERLTAAGIDLVGIGIKSNAVERFYENSIVLHEIADLPKAVMGELKKILTK